MVFQKKKDSVGNGIWIFLFTQRDWTQPSRFSRAITCRGHVNCCWGAVEICCHFGWKLYQENGSPFVRMRGDICRLRQKGRQHDPFFSKNIEIKSYKFGCFQNTTYDTSNIGGAIQSTKFFRHRDVSVHNTIRIDDHVFILVVGTLTKTIENSPNKTGRGGDILVYVLFSRESALLLNRTFQTLLETNWSKLISLVSLFPLFSRCEMSSNILCPTPNPASSSLSNATPTHQTKKTPEMFPKKIPSLELLDCFDSTLTVLDQLGKEKCKGTQTDLQRKTLGGHKEEWGVPNETSVFPLLNCRSMIFGNFLPGFAASNWAMLFVENFFLVGWSPKRTKNLSWFWHHFQANHEEKMEGLEEGLGRRQ